MTVTGSQQAIAAFLGAVGQGQPWREVLLEEAAKLPRQEARILAQVLDANRLTRLACEALAPFDDPCLRALKAELKTKVRELDMASISRDAVLRVLSETLHRFGIEYAVFKTLNGFGSVGVDIDIVINPSDFAPCLKVLHSRGFRIIDEPSKRYATGLVLGANPIIVDLHTDLAVLGVRYAPPEPLLRDAQEVPYPPGSHDSFSLWTAPKHADALTRMAHAIVKEGTVTLMDVAEVLRQTVDGASDISARAKDAGLQLAVSTFSWVALHAVRVPSLTLWLDIPDTTLHSIVKGALARTNGEMKFPMRMPLAVILAALVDRLDETGEILTVFKAFRALCYSRNIGQLRLRIAKRIAPQV